MTEIECSRCSSVYDTDRETDAPKADTARCPSCGKRNPVPTPDGGSTGDEAAADVELTVKIEITAPEP